jgi:hypothetical protein
VADVAEKQLKTLRKLIETAEINLAGAKELLASMVSDEGVVTTPSRGSGAAASSDPSASPGKVIEGQFDGQNMLGPDGKVYPVPANYASKSKLVQGDTLKLTIGEDGSFIYKQIGPVERRKLIGTLTLKDGQYYVEAGEHSYHVLFASVTYFKAQPGDQVTIVTPEDSQSDWAAVEAVIA